MAMMMRFNHQKSLTTMRVTN